MVFFWCCFSFFSMKVSVQKAKPRATKTRSFFHGLIWGSLNVGHERTSALHQFSSCLASIPRKMGTPQNVVSLFQFPFDTSIDCRFLWVRRRREKKKERRWLYLWAWHLGSRLAVRVGFQSLNNYHDGDGAFSVSL